MPTAGTTPFCSFLPLCAPPMQLEVATTSMPKTLLLTWSSSAPLRTFSCEQLAQWSQTELGSCMNPRMSPLSMLAGLGFGRVPLFPCFLDGNATSTIQYKYAGRLKQAFKIGCADGQGPASCWGSHVYEINDWLWSFGRPQPRVGGLSVAKTEEISRKSRSERLGDQEGQQNGSIRDMICNIIMYILEIHLVYTCQTFMLNKK
jgi:hypothetical protein